MAVPLDPDILLSLAEHLPVALSVVRVPGGERIYRNRAWLELVGESGGADLRTRDGAPYPEPRSPEARAIAERTTVIADDLAIQRGDGARVEVRAVAWPIGEPVDRVAIAYLDVRREAAAERARADTEHRLVRAQRLEAVGALATGAAHDVNNLVFGIKMLASELLAGELDGKRREILTQLDELTDRATALTRSLLGFARRGHQRMTTAFVHDAVAAVRDLLGRALTGVELTFALDAGERGIVLGDPAELEQLVVLLVLDARDAAQGAGRVAVRTRDVAARGREAPRLALEVSDDGPTAGRDGHAGRPAAGAGGERTGPGLAAVRSIVARHAGALEIDAGPDGRGTTIRVVLPSARRPAAKPRPALADLPRGSGTVLVIDDEQTIRRIVTSSLGVLGYDTIEAASGGEAIGIFRARHGEIRAVVLDMVMPGMTGRATYLALREVDASVPVLLMSGHTMDEHVQEILDLGVRSFLSKPYSIGSLAKAMADLLG